MPGLAAEVSSGLLILALHVGLPSLRALTFPTCGPWAESVGEAVSKPLERAAGCVGPLSKTVLCKLPVPAGPEVAHALSGCKAHPPM